MQHKLGFLIVVTMLGGSALPAQTLRANITGGGSRGEGKCTVEVNVDGAAQVEVRGDTASVRTLQGQPAQLRRFECTSPMPQNPVGLRFEGVDGRGLQRLVRDPRSGGAAVVYIEDKDNGREGYTFDLFWQNSGGGYDPRSGNGDQFGRPGGNGPGFGGPPPVNGPSFPGPRFSERQAARACEDAVRDRAADRFGARSVNFFDEHFEPARDRDDARFTGSMEIRRGRDRDRFQFSCRVDFRERRIESVDLDPVRR